MEIRVLRYFLTVVREVHITQPTLSRQLSQMEEEVGVKLFHRGTRRITLTNEGILLRRRAEEILQLVDKTEKELIEQEEQVEGKISIDCGEIAAVQVLPELIKTFREKYPRVTFDIFTAAADLVKEQMDRGLLDIGLLLEPVDMEKYDFIRPEVKEKWVVLMRSDSPLAEKRSVTAKDLSELPLMTELALTLLVGMIDSVMVSSAGEEAVSGVSLIDTVFQLLIYIFAAGHGGGGNCNGHFPLCGGRR